MPDQIGDLLHKPLSSYGIDKEAQAAFICVQYNKLLVDLYGEKFVSHVEAVMFRNQELHVNVENSAWAQELRLRQAEILREFAKKNPPHKIGLIGQIARVRYVVGTGVGGE